MAFRPIKAKNRVAAFKLLNKQIASKLKVIKSIITTLSKPHVDNKVLAKSLVARGRKVEKALAAASKALHA